MESTCLFGHIFARMMIALTNKDHLNSIHLMILLNLEISRLNLNREMKMILQHDLMIRSNSIGMDVNQRVTFPHLTKWDSL